MTNYLVYSIYSYIAFGACWKIKKLYKEKKEHYQTNVWNYLGHFFRIMGTILLIAHLSM